MRKIGTFEAKTHFCALVEAAERGETIIVTRKGKPVAELGPLRSVEKPLTRRDAIERILSRQLKAGASARELIEEGRRR